VRASKKDLDELNGRPLSEWTFVAVFVDGAAFAEHAAVVALGITASGEKKVLGVREGATENAELVRDLLANLLERGLTLTRVLLVIDGSRALRRAIRDSFGERTGPALRRPSAGGAGLVAVAARPHLDAEGRRHQVRALGTGALQEGAQQGGGARSTRRRARRTARSTARGTPAPRARRRPA